MVHETDPVLFSDWIWPSLAYFLQIAAVLGLLALVAGFLVAAFRYGPVAGGDVVYRMVRTGLGDLVSISPRRIMPVRSNVFSGSRRKISAVNSRFFSNTSQASCGSS